jgi:hypothetical protein
MNGFQFWIFKKWMRFRFSLAWWTLDISIFFRNVSTWLSSGKWIPFVNPNLDAMSIKGTIFDKRGNDGRYIGSDTNLPKS